MLLDHIADGGKQACDIAPTHPAPAFRIENCFQFFGDKRHIATAAEYSADHACERDRPGVVLEILGVDENLKWPPPPVADNVIDGDVKCVWARRPFDLVRQAFERRVALQRLRHVDDAGGWRRDRIARGGWRRCMRH